ncbi:helix-turn-helix domain-containing protein [Rhodococcus sp. DMU2021]|nr:helix-turn-helix domain-containing protein [Rhodococcus sp. DMU2021]
MQLYERGLTGRAVAEEVGIGRTTVLKILRAEGAAVRPRGARY